MGVRGGHLWTSGFQRAIDEHFGGQDIFPLFGDAAGIVQHTEELVYLTILVVVIIGTSLGDHTVKFIEEKQGGSFLLCFLE